MTKLTLTNYVRGNTTLLENEFIDEYMPKANGEYVKVYLLLLRYMGDPSMEITISGIADLLECTEKDVVRALNYWKKQGLVDYEAGMQEIQEVRQESEAVKRSMPARGGRAGAKKAEELPPSQKNRENFKEVIHVTEQYLGKTLTKTESEAIVYFYDEIGMSSDLIEYLIEYCVENGHKSIHYIRKVALSWAEQRIQTPEEAKAVSGQYSKNSYAVLNAYGIKGRAPAAAELKFIRRWNEEYGFSSDLIVEACNRTMKTIHQPSFDYTDSILKKWVDKGVKTLADVKALDSLHLQEKGAKKAAVVGTARAARNKFNNFEGRKYQDMDELTRRLIETQ
jgi:DnaD/phage-associated family protein